MSDTNAPKPCCEAYAALRVAEARRICATHKVITDNCQACGLMNKGAARGGPADAHTDIWREHLRMVARFTLWLDEADRITCEFYGPGAEIRNARMAVTSWLRDRLQSAGTERSSSTATPPDEPTLVAQGRFMTTAKLGELPSPTWDDATPSDSLRSDLRAVLAPLRALPRYNCDCLNAGPDGEVSDDEESIYCPRWVVLASDLDAALTALLALLGPEEA